MALQYFKCHSSGDTLWVKAMVFLLVIWPRLKLSAMGKYLGIECFKFIKYLTAFIAQLFYILRQSISTNTLNGSNQWSLDETLSIFAYPVVILSCTQVASDIAQVVMMGHAKTFLNFGRMTYITFKVMIVQGVSAAANQSEINSRTHSLLTKFIIYAINRAAATRVCALLTVFMFHYLSGTYS
ncbi:hypothetical protein BDQ17DRAFT_1413890 [Cyathus striatus]|nr:hypothetical protein BDQ17DRAFT_1413890 [Cyathus striatus]